MSTILGVWQPAYSPLTHTATGLDFPANTGMTPAHYRVHIEARHPDGTGHTLLRLAPYTQTRHTDRDTDRLNTHLTEKADTITPGATLRAAAAPFDVNDHTAHQDPDEADTVALLAAAIDQEETP